MAKSPPFFVPTVACVRRAIAALVAVQANRVTPGYLCVLESAAQAGRLDNLQPRFGVFFERHLRVGDAPERKPYLVPFGRVETGAALLFNRNVAGSYAPSSIRDVNALHDVLEISPTGTFTLREDHLQAVHKRILRRPLPFCATACFLYRDYGFAPKPSSESLLQQLDEQFGFALDHDLLDSGVFMDDRGDFGPNDFELLSVS
jgi:hypothetical protein